MSAPNFMTIDQIVVKIFYSEPKSLIDQHYHLLLWLKVVIIMVSIYVSVRLVGLKSLEVSDMAAVFTGGLKVTVSEPFFG